MNLNPVWAPVLSSVVTSITTIMVLVISQFVIGIRETKTRQAERRLRREQHWADVRLNSLFQLQTAAEEWLGSLADPVFVKYFERGKQPETTHHKLDGLHAERMMKNYIFGVKAHQLCARIGDEEITKLVVRMRKASEGAYEAEEPSAYGRQLAEFRRAVADIDNYLFKHRDQLWL